MIIGTLIFLALVVCYLLECKYSKALSESQRSLKAAEHNLKMVTDPAYKAFVESLEFSRKSGYKA